MVSVIHLGAHLRGGNQEPLSDKSQEQGLQVIADSRETLFYTSVELKMMWVLYNKH